MKGLILAAGKGARMKGIYYNKCLGVVNNKSLISHSIERLLLMGIFNIIIVVGKDGDMIKDHIATYQQCAKISFVEQKIQLGIVDAIKCAVSIIGADDFALCLGDEMFYKQKPVEMLNYFFCSEADCVCAIVPDEKDEEIKKCYTVHIDEDNNILELDEKPERPLNHLKGTGFCIFKNRMLKHIGDVSPNSKSGQYDLCDWIRICIEKGMVCKVYDFAEREFNINTVEDLQQANQFFDA
jgi:dTDP-glucose pyrophosphorylase